MRWTQRHTARSGDFDCLFMACVSLVVRRWKMLVPALITNCENGASFVFGAWFPAVVTRVTHRIVGRRTRRGRQPLLLWFVVWFIHGLRVRFRLPWALAKNIPLCVDVHFTRDLDVTKSLYPRTAFRSSMVYPRSFVILDAPFTEQHTQRVGHRWCGTPGVGGR